ncbi:LysM peptidoglycan-binding domain-containing protein [Neobacillus mesonae]|uniref:LysM peptidoglycan-binding domain-containing protein n=1 Tax=Neobacillus mesonae TaxID=1193713 RepID=UPI0025737563|nr:LysM peptidoglycan-binding domain-containing protein [Neobacillus mesonae]
MTKELFVNGELVLMRKDVYAKSRQVREVPVFTSRMQKREYYQSVNPFDIRNALDIKGLLKEISANWNTYVSQVHQWIQKIPVKRLIVTGVFTVVLGCFASTSNAAFIQEYVYQVKSGENIEVIAKEHGVTAQEILDANGLTSIDGKKILLPKVHNRIVTATILNIRSLPTTSSSIIGKYKKGDVVKVAFVENGWAGILIKGRVCYINMDYLTQKQENAVTTDKNTKTIKSQAKTMYVTAASLRVREGASINSTVAGSLNLNDRVSVIKSLYGWAQINFNGKTAFVNDAYLTSVEPKKIINDSNTNSSKTISSSEYVIKSGDTYTKIAKELRTSVLSIQELNPTVDPYKLKIGQKIKIPTSTTSTDIHVKVTAHIAGIDSKGTFRFIALDGKNYAAKASGDLINELFKRQGEIATLTLKGKRGQLMTLISLQ